MSGGGSSGGGDVTQTQQTDLPEWLKPHATNFMGRADSLSNMPYQSYDGQLVAGMTPEHEMALQGITNRSIYGSPTENMANVNMMNTLGGSYMNPSANPWLSETVRMSNADIGEAYNKGIASQTDLAASQAGSLGQGNSAYGETVQDNQKTLADALAKNTTGIYGQNYQNERDAQQRAMAMAPTFGQLDYRDLNALNTVGDSRQAQNQAILNSDYGQFLEQRQYPYDQLNVLGNALGATMGTGGQITSTSPAAQTNPLMAGMGGAMLGGELASQYGGSMINPWMGAGMGMLGGLML